MNVHKAQNRLAEQLGEETHNEILALLASQMEFGYRIAFPVLISDAGKPQLSVALLARSNDYRLREIKELTPSPQASHVFLFFVFSNEADWQRYVRKIVKIFPEQRQFA